MKANMSHPDAAVLQYNSLSPPLTLCPTRAGEQLSSVPPAAVHPADAAGARARPLQYLAGSGGRHQQSCTAGTGL